MNTVFYHNEVSTRLNIVSIFKLSNMIIVGLFIYLCIVTQMYLNFGKYSIVNFESILYMYSLVAVIIMMLKLSGRVMFAVAVITAQYVFLKYCLSAIFLLAVPVYGPEYVQDRLLSDGFTTAHYNNSLFYALTCSIVILLAFYFNRVQNPGKFMDRVWPCKFSNFLFAPLPLAICSFGLISVNLYKYSIGVGRHYSVPAEGSLQWLNTFQNPVAIQTLLLVSIAFFWSRHSLIRKWILVILVVAFFATSVFTGSRSFAYTWLLTAVFILCALHGDFKASPKSVLYVGLSIAIAFCSFPIALGFRNAGREELSYSAVLSSVVVEVGKFISNLPIFAIRVVERLSEIESSMMIVNDMYVNDPTEHLTITADLMRVVNNLVPGDLFDGVISPPRLFDYVYRGLEVNYNTQEWGVFEYFYVWFGSGMLPMVFILFLTIFYLWKRILLIRNSMKPVMVVFFISLYWLLLKNAGMSLWVSQINMTGIVFCFYLVIIALIHLFIQIFNSFKGVLSRRGDPQYHSLMSKASPDND